MEIWRAARVLNGGNYILAGEVAGLESEIAGFLGVSADRVVTCASGTDAITLALESTKGGRPGGEVIVPALTFSATYEAVLRTGAAPVVADIDQKHLTPSLSQIEALLTDKTSAVIMVHIYGWAAADIMAIRDLCRDREIILIEDVAQAFGATIEGINVATIGDAAALSFYPTKPLGGVGDGGAVVFKDERQAAWARARRNHGRNASRQQIMAGYNSCFDEVNATILRYRLARYRETLEHLRNLAALYSEKIGFLSIDVPRSSRPAPYVYPILVDGRERVAGYLEDTGAVSGIHYDPPISGLPYVAAQCPTANRMMRKQMSLPCHRKVTLADVDWICEVVLS
jgi:dTDP-4-amino-4,6-dideoxygalactose transaminase